MQDNPIYQNIYLSLASGADPGFQVRGAHFKKLRRAEGGAKIFRVFRVENHEICLPRKKSFILYSFLCLSCFILYVVRGCCGRDHMVVRFITTQC
jgi:hypothetical protein